MPTVIDSLVVQLGLDRGELTKGVGEAKKLVEEFKETVKEDAEEVEKFVEQKVELSLHRIFLEASALLGLLLAAHGVREFIASASEMNTQLSHFAATIYETPESLSSFQNAVARYGGDSRAAANSLRSLSDVIIGMNQEGKEAPGWWWRIGGADIDTSKGPLSIFVQLTEKMERSGLTKPEQAEILRHDFNINDEGEIAFMLEGAKKVRAELADARQDAITTPQARAAATLLSSWEKASQAAKSLGSILVETVQPIVTPLLEGLRSWIEESKKFTAEWVGEKMKQFRDWVESIDWAGLFRNLVDLAKGVNEVVVALGGWKTVALELFEVWTLTKFAGMISSFSSLAGLFVGVVNATKPLIETLAATFAAYKALQATGLADGMRASLRWITGTQPSSQQQGQAPSAPTPPARPATGMGGKPADMPAEGSSTESMEGSDADRLIDAILQPTAIKSGGSEVGPGNPMPVTPQDRNTAGGFWSDIGNALGSLGSDAGGPSSDLGGGGFGSMRPRLSGPRRGRGGGGRSGNGPGADVFPSTGTATALSIVRRMMHDYGWTREQAIGAAGVMAYESGNFRVMQEIGQAPGHGGWGWAQWTGDRRRWFMDYARRHGFDPSSDEANYGYMATELAGHKRGVVEAMRRARNATEAADIWEHQFEGMTEGGPGIPAFGAHQARARALDRALPRDIGQLPASGAGANAPSVANHLRTSMNTSNNDVHIAQVQVYTSNTNPQAIARDVHLALRDQLLGHNVALAV